MLRLIDLNSHRTAATSLNLSVTSGRNNPAHSCPHLLMQTSLRCPHVSCSGGRLRVFTRMEVYVSGEMFDNGSFKEQGVLRVLKWLLPAADGIVAVSQGVADDLIRLLPVVSPRVTTIYNPVVTLGHAAKAAVPIKHPWFDAENVPVLLSAGRLVPQKDYATLLRAFAEVISSRPARLVILGVGPERENLLELAECLKVSQQVDLPGFEVNPFAYMSRSRVFVLSSRYEGFPNVLAQAMACGTPVVSTDCRSGPREILEDGKWGRLVPVGRLARYGRGYPGHPGQPGSVRPSHLQGIGILR